MGHNLPLPATREVAQAQGVGVSSVCKQLGVGVSQCCGHRYLGGGTPTGEWGESFVLVCKGGEEGVANRGLSNIGTGAQCVCEAVCKPPANVA
jgi:hypothetical protein